MDGKSTLDHLYAAIHRAENKVGGGEGLVGIYGSMTQQGTENIMSAMAQLAGLDQSSVLVDIGSGLCRPLLHATVQYGVHRTFGVELDAVKCQKAVPFVQHAASQLEVAGVKLRKEVLPTIICASVEQLGSLDPATHAYAAWEGFPVQAKMAVGDLFVATPSLRSITIVQRSLRNEDPAEAMADLGFGPVKLLSPAIPVYMAGSHRRLNAYIFAKDSQPTTAASKGSMHGCDAVKNQRAAGGGKCTWEGSDSQAARPSLSTAVPFDPAAVMEALARMDGSAELAMTTTTGRRSSNKSAAAMSALGEGNKGSIQGLQRPGASQPLHGHGLRPNRKRSAHALQLDEETNKGYEEEGCVGGSGSGAWVEREGVKGRAQLEGRQSMPSTGLSSIPLVITTRRRSQRTSTAHRGSGVSEPTAAADAAAAAAAATAAAPAAAAAAPAAPAAAAAAAAAAGGGGNANGGTGGAQQGLKTRLPWQLQQEHSVPAVAIGTAVGGPHASLLAPLGHQTRAAVLQAEQAAAFRRHSMPGSVGPAAYAAAPGPAAQHVDRSQSRRSISCEHAPQATTAARVAPAPAPAPPAQHADSSHPHGTSSCEHAPPATTVTAAGMAPTPAAQHADSSREHRRGSSAHALAEAQQVGSSRPYKARLSERMVTEPQGPEKQATAKRGSGCAAEDGYGTGVAGGTVVEGAGNGGASRGASGGHGSVDPGFVCGTAVEGAGNGSASRGTAEGHGGASDDGVSSGAVESHGGAAANGIDDNGGLPTSQVGGAGGSGGTHIGSSASHGMSMQTRLRCTTGDAGCGVREGLGMQVQARSAVEEVIGGAAGGGSDGAGAGIGMQTRARGAAGGVIEGAGAGNGMQTSARGAAGETSDGASDGKGVQTRARSAAGTAAAAAAASAAVGQPLDLQARAPAARAAQLPLFAMRRETKPKSVAAQPEICTKRARETPASSGHVGAEGVQEPAAKLRKVAGCPKQGG